MTKEEIMQMIREYLASEGLPDHSHTLDKIQFTDLLGVEGITPDAYAAGTLNIFDPLDADTERICYQTDYTKIKDASVVRKGVLTAGFYGKYAAGDFTAWTQVDPNSHIGATADTITFTTLAGTETAYIYKDFTAGYWSGSFNLKFKFNMSAADGDSSFAILGLANDLEGAYNWEQNSHSHLKIFYYDNGVGDRRLSIHERVGVNQYASTHYDISLATNYWVELIRDETVGTYGTLYLKVYTDAYTTLVNTQTLTLNAKTDFRYLVMSNSYNDGAAPDLSGTIVITAGTNYARLYIDGVAVGTERTLTTSYVEYSENVDVVRGESVQVYAKSSNGFDGAYIKDFTLKADAYDHTTVILD